MIEQEPPRAVEWAREQVVARKQENELLHPSRRDPHFDVIDPDQITPREAELWSRIESAESEEDFASVLADLQSEKEALREYVSARRAEDPGYSYETDHKATLLAWLSNRIMGRMNQLARRDDLDRR